MAIFRTPTDNFVRPTLAESLDNRSLLSASQRLDNRLARFRPATARGRNVYQLNDLSYTEKQPGDMSTVLRTYHGGHDIPVTEEEIASLTAAGYGAYIQ
jgi:hypothetical protein